MPKSVFTSKERDAETGLDYFGARYFSSAQGRFTSADPLGSSAKVSNPQTWNRYTYGLNNPLRFVDPDGLDVPDSCAKDNSCQIVVKVNVIYDQTVNNGNLKSGVSGLLDGVPTSFLNVNEVMNGNYGPIGSNTTEHELGHQFLGDPFGGGSNSPIGRFFQNIGRDHQIDTQNTLQQSGAVQSGYRVGLEPRRYAVPADPNAAKPQQK